MPNNLEMFLADRFSSQHIAGRIKQRGRKRLCIVFASSKFNSKLDKGMNYIFTQSTREKEINQYFCLMTDNQKLKQQLLESEQSQRSVQDLAVCADSAEQARFVALAGLS